MNPVLPAPKREPTPDQHIFHLIRSFPCLAKRARPWLDRATEFDPDHFHSQFARASSSEALSALFILNVWNDGYARTKGWSFDLRAFMSNADDGSRAAFLAWMKNPYWL